MVDECAFEVRMLDGNERCQHISWVADMLNCITTLALIFKSVCVVERRLPCCYWTLTGLHAKIASVLGGSETSTANRSAACLFGRGEDGIRGMGRERERCECEAAHAPNKAF